MHTTRFSGFRGRGLPNTHGGRPPCRKTPLEYGTRLRDPLEGTWDQAARHEVTSYKDPLVNRQTLVKKLPCPELRLQVVTMFSINLKGNYIWKVQRTVGSCVLLLDAVTHNCLLVTFLYPGRNKIASTKGSMKLFCYQVSTVYKRFPCITGFF